MKRLFRQFQTLKKPGDTDGMRPIVQAACKALAIHALIEEEIFYPALRENTEATDALAEASVEHHHVKELVMKLGSSAPGDDLFAARVTVLSEYVEHHVKEEEGTLFAKARRARFDLVALGDQLQAQGRARAARTDHRHRGAGGEARRERASQRPPHEEVSLRAGPG